MFVRKSTYDDAVLKARHWQQNTETLYDQFSKERLKLTNEIGKLDAELALVRAQRDEFKAQIEALPIQRGKGGRFSKRGDA